MRKNHIFIKRNVVRMIASMLLLCFALCIFPSCESASNSATCQLCNKTYTYEHKVPADYGYRNVYCIRTTNMCVKCYKDFCYINGIKPDALYWE